MQHRAAEREALLPTAGQRRHQRLLAAAKPGHFDGEAHALAQFGARHAVDAAEEAQILLDRKVAVEREFLRHVADMFAHPFGITRDVDAGDEYAPGGRPQQAAENADRGRLAGAVGAEKPHDLAAPDAKAHVIDGDEIAEPFDQILDDDLRVGYRRCRSLPRPFIFEQRHEHVLDAGSGDRDVVERHVLPRCNASRSCGNPQGGIIDDGVNAAADQNDVTHARAGRRWLSAPPVRSRTKWRRRRPGMRCLSAAGVSQWSTRP